MLREMGKKNQTCTKRFYNDAFGYETDSILLCNRKNDRTKKYKKRNSKETREKLEEEEN